MKNTFPTCVGRMDSIEIGGQKDVRLILLLIIGNSWFSDFQQEWNSFSWCLLLIISKLRYPEQLAWQTDLNRSQIRKNPHVQTFYAFLIEETESVSTYGKHCAQGSELSILPFFVIRLPCNLCLGFFLPKTHASAEACNACTLRLQRHMK